MTLSTWQLIVVGALAAIWAVVLGVPLLADLLRWLRNRPPASSTERRPLRQRVAALPAHVWSSRPRPLAAWRAQQIAQQRLQILSGSGLASVLAMFLAIAFRGIFVSLFMLMLGLSLLVVAVGAVIRARERRDSARQQSEQDDNKLYRSAIGPGPATDTAIERLGAASIRPDIDLTIDGVPTANPWQSPDGEYTIPTIAEITEAFQTPDRDGFMFEPLNLDEVLSSDGSGPAMTVPEVDIDIPVDPDLVAELGLDLSGADQPRFEAAPEVGPHQASARARRSKRRRARPIYIESALDEQEDPGKAVND